jgi:D-alanyl-D-alanine dipeptidase
MLAAGSQVLYERRHDAPPRTGQTMTSPRGHQAMRRIVLLLVLAAAVPAGAVQEAPPRDPRALRAPDLVELVSLDPTLHLDVRYATSDNLVGRPVYGEARAFLQRPAAEALVQANRDLAAQGYGIVVFDGYRPWSVTKLFWDLVPPEKHAYVADPREGSKHNRGAAVDVSLYDLRTGQPVDMPSGYDETSERAHPTYDGGTAVERANRDLLRAAMERNGFSVEPNEWWHFNYKDWRDYPILDVAFEQIGARGGAASLRDPPPHDAGPIQVTLGLYVLNISSIDEARESFTLDAYLFADWKDERLAYAPAGKRDVSRSHATGEIWVPAFVLANAASPRSTVAVQIAGDADGRVHYIEQFTTTLSSDLMLERFPFDAQSLRVLVQPFLSEASEVTFVDGDQRTGWDRQSYSSLDQWTIRGMRQHAEQRSLEPHRSSFTQMIFEVDVKRQYEFYLWKVFLPLLLMVVLSWTVLLIDPGDLDNQIQISITTILTVIAFAFSIATTLPKVPYLTYIDTFFLGCYVFVFFSIVELMTVNVVLRRRGRDAGLRIRRLSRWLFPGAFVATNWVVAMYFFR